ncbi:MAG TPA: FtsX-like permease family protein [Pyrinomonadaceae bacterium]|nr:FtsX-like permease family protein [Pyrinomonadaceae bacterium]
MAFLDILYLALRNLRQAKLRAALTSMGVIVGVAVIVTMVSFGLGLQRNMLARFKALDLFNEINVFGRSLSSLASAGIDRARGDGERRGPRGRPDKTPTRILDDAAIAEISRIPGVAYVEPNMNLFIYMRANGRVLTTGAAGASVPNASSRFQQFIAGRMIASENADEAVVSERFTRDFGFEKPADAVGQTVEFLAPEKETKSGKTGNENENTDEEGPSNFFGIPLGTDEPRQKAQGIAIRKFRIAGVLSTEIKEGPGQGGFRGLLPPASIYIPLPAAREWGVEHRGPMSQVALALARGSGQLSDEQSEGYDSAIIRVTDPAMLTEVRKRLTDAGFGSFSIVDQLDQIRTVFLILDSVLGLLGGISLLVASFGIANTMIMSILERTREIGIMKAIGAEDREIKLIFFVEAAVIGLTGGVLGTLLAWGIDAIANRLAYRFVLKPQGASFIDFFSLPPYLSFGAILFALVVSILAALYPASRAARIDPVRALRHD